MKKRFFILLSLFTYGGYGQETFTPTKTPEKNIILDGQISKGEWEDAVEIHLDIEFNPANNQPARKETIGYITYSDRYLFIAVHAKDDPSNIRASIRPRDDFNIWRDDVFLVRLDPYTDSRNNLGLAVNPFGSQFDVKQVNALTDEQRYDSSFNINFESVGRVVSDGYQVEMKIPFSEIPFPNGENQLWHINLYRHYFENGNEIEVSSQIRDRDNSCVVCQTTDKLVLKGIKIDKRFELLPFVTSSIQGQRKTPSESMSYQAIKADVGLGVNLDVNKNTSLEVTLNPDFSQVEADVTQIDVNSSFSLQYPERRPFFNRGTDIVNFSDGAFYSRSIVNPIIASKVLSQSKKGRFFLLNAIDQTSPYLIGGEDRSYLGEGEQSVVNVLRYQHLLNISSRIGALMTNRLYKGGGYGHLLGLDGLFLLNKNWRLSFEAFKNFNQEPVQNWINSEEIIHGKTVQLDGEQLDGNAFYIQLYRNTEHWQSYLFFRDLSAHYRADVGFAVRNNRRWGTFFHQYTNILNKKAIQSFSFGTKVDLVYTHQNLYKTFSVDLFAEVISFGQTQLEYTLDFDAVKTFLEVRYDNLPTHQISIEGSPYEALNFEIEWSTGKDLSVNEKTPEVGEINTSFFTFSLQLNDKLNINPSLRFAQLKRLNGGPDYFNGNIARLNLRYQFNTAFNIRLIAEQNTFTEQFYLQPLIQWNPNPATIFYLGGNQNTLKEIDNIQFKLFQFNQTQLFFKFQYLFDL